MAYRTKTTNTLVLNTNADWAGSKVDKRSTMGYCVFCGNLVVWRSKKQNVLSCLIAESECRATGLSTCELLCIIEVGLQPSLLAKMWCDNKAALHITSK